MPPAPAAEPRRVLVVVDDACTAPELPVGVRAAAGDAPVEALVVAPGRGAAATQWYVDEDAARADATRRLRACVGLLAGGGIRATGVLGDPDPIRAIADALASFPADEILLVTAAHRPSRWLRRNVAADARRAFRQPVTRLLVPATSERSDT